MDILKNLNGIYKVSRQYTKPVLIDVLDRMNMSALGTVAGFMGALQTFFTAASGPNATRLLSDLSYGQNQRRAGLAYYGTQASWERLVMENVTRQFLQGGLPGLARRSPHRSRHLRKLVHGTL